MTNIEREKQVVHQMIEIFCKAKHNCKSSLCNECAEIDEYAMKRLSLCKYGENKPTCKKCPIHCYAPQKRDAIREIMRYSGPRMIWHHPIAAIRHLIKEL